MNKKPEIKAIIGLGNPGPKFTNNRHNIGFLILDELAQNFDASWQKKDILEIAEIRPADTAILLIKPQTFMNASGRVIPFLQKKGIRPENILVIHDELELPFGKMKIKFGGSAKGHNGLRSIIEAMGKDFWHLSFGIGRPENREEVGNYVLSDFQENSSLLAENINKAVKEITHLFSEEKLK